jgi:hypothetical protein
VPFLLDTNVFINAKNDYYGFEFAPGFWDWLDQENEAGRVFSVERVGQELADYGDELTDWSRPRMGTLFLAPDDDVVRSLQVTSVWASGAGYEAAAVAAFLAGADYYLVGHAHARAYTVVTHEKPANTPKKIKIPNACTAMDVPCIGLFELLRMSGAKLVLEGP